jgi:hypothetical protein
MAIFFAVQLPGWRFLDGHVSTRRELDARDSHYPAR